MVAQQFGIQGGGSGPLPLPLEPCMDVWASPASLGHTSQEATQAVMRHPIKQSPTRVS